MASGVCNGSWDLRQILMPPFCSPRSSSSGEGTLSKGLYVLGLAGGEAGWIEEDPEGQGEQWSQEGLGGSQKAPCPLHWAR